MKSPKKFGKGIPKIKLDYTNDDLLTEIEGLARDGYDDKQIALILGIAPNTFSRNKVRRSEASEENPKGESLLSRALKKGRAPLSVEVENSLYKRAIGMHVKRISTTEQFLLLHDGTKTDTKIIKTIVEIIELPPDTAAAIFWLKNHKPHIYRQIFPQKNNSSEISRLEELPKISRIEHVTVDVKNDKLKDNLSCL